jgi:hypothetical protein
MDESLVLANELYEAGEIEQAKEHLDRLYGWNPELEGVASLLAWSNWRLGRPVDAEALFERAYQADPSQYEVTQGLGMVRLSLGDVQGALPVLEGAARARPFDVDAQLTLAEAYRRAGLNLVAARIYHELRTRDPSLFQAENGLLEIFGYTRIGSEAPPTSLPERQRPASLETHFRTQGEYFQARNGQDWRTIYLRGVNLGPARPGEFAVSASLDFDVYAEWLQQIAAMNANTVRVYTILAPAFYQALAAHNAQAAEPLWLIQEIWIEERVTDLFDPASKADFEQEVRDAIDVIHGHADVECVPGHYCGVYTADVSRYVAGLGVGRELEPSLVRRTNRLNPERVSYSGEFVKLAEGVPSESWFAEMFDLAAQYEMETYNTQHPIGLVTWPPLDPMRHLTEATYEEEFSLMAGLGEPVPSSVPPDADDMDVVTIDMRRFERGPRLETGLFAITHVYQHWPDFLFLEEHYAEAEDDLGPNRYLGYLRELKAAHGGLPLIIGEYGLSTSMTPAHLHPQGWHNGGITEQEQADLLVRFSRNIRDTGFAGGIVFSWLDEWWKQVHDLNTAPFEGRRSFDPLWLSQLDPEEHFGLVGFRPFQDVPLLRGSAADWVGARRLYVGLGGRDATGAVDPLLGISATSDYAFLYLRLDVQTEPGFDWGEWRFWVALNTLPGGSGSRTLPGGEIRIEQGANFLLEIDGQDRARLLVAENYNPFDVLNVEGRPGMTRIWTKRNMEASLEEEVPFEEMSVEVNRRRFSRDGREYRSQNYNHSILPFGIADPEHADYASHAMWHVDPESGMVEVRIPWPLLLVAEPPNREVFAGLEDQLFPVPFTRPTPGVSIAAFAFQMSNADNGDTGEPILRSAFPPLAEGSTVGDPSLYDWDTWTSVRFSAYFKPSYFALQEFWSTMPRFAN